MQIYLSFSLLEWFCLWGLGEVYGYDAPQYDSACYVEDISMEAIFFYSNLVH